MWSSEKQTKQKVPQLNMKRVVEHYTAEHTQFSLLDADIILVKLWVMVATWAFIQSEKNTRESQSPNLEAGEVTEWLKPGKKAIWWPHRRVNANLPHQSVRKGKKKKSCSLFDLAAPGSVIPAEECKLLQAYKNTYLRW